MPKAASVEELLKSGAHFGHLTRRWNPKMKEFIFMQRNGIHIIDLKKTHQYLTEALEEVTNLARAGKTILFVGTKKQSQEIIRTEAIRSGMPFVTHRWLGGMLTNFSTVRKSISRMEEIERMSKDGTFDELTKKEGLMLERERQKLEDTLGGIANMTRLPGAIFVVDTIKEHIAVNEAVKLNIPIIAMVDTNSDPDIPDYIVPCNDDSARTIKLVTGLIADAIIEGNAEREAMKEEQLMEQAAEEARSSKDEEGQTSEADVKVKTKTRRRKRKRKDPEQQLQPQEQNETDSDPDSDSEKDTKAESDETGSVGEKDTEAGSDKAIDKDTETDSDATTSKAEDDSGVSADEKKEQKTEAGKVQDKEKTAPKPDSEPKETTAEESAEKNKDA